MDRKKLEKYLNWDIDTWGVGFRYIIAQLHRQKTSEPKTVLELGCNKGGISVGIVNELGYDVVCSDIDFPEERVLKFHPGMEGNKKLQFDAVDGLKIKYPDQSFDIVIFKSVLGYIRSKEEQQQFINEIYRVLKKGGVFYFLENNRGSALHQYARRKFVSWGNEWQYVTIDEMKQYLGSFQLYNIHANGFLTAFAKPSAIKRIAFFIDRIISVVIPNESKYVMYGMAIK